MKTLVRLISVFTLLAAPLLHAQEAATPAAPRPQYPDPTWVGTLTEAVDRARNIKGGRILVELRDEQCPGCDRMETLVYPAASFRAFMNDKVAVNVRRATPEGKRLGERFRVRTSPAWLVLTPDLLLCGKQEGESNQSVWFERLLESEKGWAAFRRKIEEEKKAPADVTLAFAIGEEAYRRSGDAMAEERFRRVSGDVNAPVELRGKSLAFLATIALDARRLDDAEKALKQLQAIVKDPVLLERAELRLADVEIGRGEKAKAVARLKAFLHAHPDSPARPQVETLLRAIGAAKP
jgi:hypothetical protein